MESKWKNKTSQKEHREAFEGPGCRNHNSSSQERRMETETEEGGGEDTKRETKNVFFNSQSGRNQVLVRIKDKK